MRRFPTLPPDRSASLHLSVRKSGRSPSHPRSRARIPRARRSPRKSARRPRIEQPARLVGLDRLPSAAPPGVRSRARRRPRPAASSPPRRRRETLDLATEGSRFSSAGETQFLCHPDGQSQSQHNCLFEQRLRGNNHSAQLMARSAYCMIYTKQALQIACIWIRLCALVRKR